MMVFRHSYFERASMIDGGRGGREVLGAVQVLVSSRLHWVGSCLLHMLPEPGVWVPGWFLLVNDL